MLVFLVDRARPFLASLSSWLEYQHAVGVSGRLCSTWKTDLLANHLYAHSDSDILRWADAPAIMSVITKMCARSDQGTINRVRTVLRRTLPNVRATPSEGVCWQLLESLDLIHDVPVPLTDLQHRGRVLEEALFFGTGETGRILLGLRRKDLRYVQSLPKVHLELIRQALNLVPRALFDQETLARHFFSWAVEWVSRPLAQEITENFLVSLEPTTLGHWTSWQVFASYTFSSLLEQPVLSHCQKKYLLRVGCALIELFAWQRRSTKVIELSSVQDALTRIVSNEYDPRRVRKLLRAIVEETHGSSTSAACSLALELLAFLSVPQEHLPFIQAEAESLEHAHFFGRGETELFCEMFRRRDFSQLHTPPYLHRELIRYYGALNPSTVIAKAELEHAFAVWANTCFPPSLAEEISGYFSVAIATKETEDWSVWKHEALQRFQDSFGCQYQESACVVAFALLQLYAWQHSPLVCAQQPSAPPLHT